MSYKLSTYRRYTWCPEDPRGREHLALSRWLEETLGKECGRWWLQYIDRLDHRYRALTGDDLILAICQYDCPELIQLLYPLCPWLFLRPVEDHRFNAVDLCAHHGSVASLETLLELGADPNDLDRLMEARSALHHDLANRAFLYQPTPLDLARAAGQEDCRLVLALWGGVTAEELFSIPRGTLPSFLPTPDTVKLLGEWDWKTWSVPLDEEV